MDCAAFKTNIFSYREGVLSEEQHHLFESHLASCIVCRQLLTEFNHLEVIIEQEKNVEPNPFAPTRILQRIENEFSVTNKSYFPGLIRVLQPVALAVALLCGIVIGSYTAKKDNARANLLVNPTENIEFLRTNLFIAEFADEDKILGFNK